MAQVYFHCSYSQGVLIDRHGTAVDDLKEARDRATGVVRSVITARGAKDWRGWAVHVTDDLGKEHFVMPFAFVLAKPPRKGTEAATPSRGTLLRES